MGSQLRCGHDQLYQTTYNEARRSQLLLWANSKRKVYTSWKLDPKGTCMQFQKLLVSIWRCSSTKYCTVHSNLETTLHRLSGWLKPPPPSLWKRGPDRRREQHHRQQASFRCNLQRMNASCRKRWDVFRKISSMNLNRNLLYHRKLLITIRRLCCDKYASRKTCKLSSTFLFENMSK